MTFFAPGQTLFALLFSEDYDIAESCLFACVKLPCDPSSVDASHRLKSHAICRQNLYAILAPISFHIWTGLFSSRKDVLYTQSFWHLS